MSRAKRDIEAERGRHLRRQAIHDAVKRVRAGEVVTFRLNRGDVTVRPLAQDEEPVNGGCYLFASGARVVVSCLTDKDCGFDRWRAVDAGHEWVHRRDIIGVVVPPGES